MHFSAKNIIKECRDQEISISSFFRAQEAKQASMTEEALDEKMLAILSVMEESAERALEKPTFSLSGMTGGYAAKAWAHQNETTLSGAFVMRSVARALSTSEVNASMGKIVAAPTAGASGILPSALFGAKEKLQLEMRELLPGLYTAGAIGKIVAQKATISGADGGCQAECGTAAAMSAAGLTELLGGTPEACFHAASFAFIHVLGLVCDPIAGFVEFPCSLRNASGLSNAFLSADLARAGLESLVPFDEVVAAMYQVGRAMPETLRETALGGIATTPTAKELEKRYL